MGLEPVLLTKLLHGQHSGACPAWRYYRREKPKGAAMTGAPDQYGDEAKLHAADLQRAMQRAQLAKGKKLTRLRLIVRRVLGRQNPPASP
jgi:hypothetical protein